MKTHIALASAFIAASSLSTAEIVVNDFLSFEGFVDMSYAHFEADIDAGIDGGPSGGITESDNSFQIDQVEISWLFDFDPVTAQIDLQYEDIPGETTIVEQAFATYHFDNGGAITAGRYASMLGFEAFEPTGLYQYSFAYGLPQSVTSIAGGIGLGGLDEALGLVVGTIFPLPGYSQGVKYTYEGENSFFGVSVQDGVYGYSDRFGGDLDADGGGYGVELAGAYYMDNGLSYFAGFAYEDGDGYGDSTFGTGDTEAWVFNTYVTFETGAWIFAFEVNYGENEWDDVALPNLDLETESLSALLMANFSYSDKASVTGRVSYVDYELEGTLSGSGSGSLDGDFLKYTLAHNYAFTDNLLLVTELSYTDIELDGSLSDTQGPIGSGDLDLDELLFAVELLFTF